MPKPQVKKTDAVPDVSSTDAYAPKRYSAREYAAMGLKMFLIVGLLFGLLWLFDALKGQ